MKRLFLLLLSILLLAPLVHAGGYEDFSAFNLDWSGGNNSRLAFYTPLTSTSNILTPPRAYPGTTATFSRASAQYITDFEGVTRKVESGSVAVEGSRVVTNLLTYSEDLSNATYWVKGNGASVLYDATESCYKFLGTGSTSYLQARASFGANGVDGQPTVSFWIKSNRDKTVSVRVTDDADGSPSSSRTINITTNWQRFSYSTTSMSFSGSYLALIFTHSNYQADDTIWLKNVQVENVTAQSNQNPGEYVKTTSAAVTKCFATTNGNTVDANGVVTEATGTSLPQSYSERQNSTAYVLNDKIQVSGWWYNCTTAGTSAGSAPTFPQGKTGTQTVTDGTAVWTTGGRLLLGYVSEPASTNKVTAYGIIPADTLGSELAVNGGFTTDSDWTKGTGWTISGGTLNAASAADGTYTRQSTVTPSPGKIYQVTYTVTAISGGGIKSFCGSTISTTPRTTTGTYTDTLLATSMSYWGIVAVGTTTASIDNVSVKEVTWAVGTKSYYTGSAFVQNITGLTLSGDTSATLSIVTDQTEIEKAGLAGINPGFKVYKLDNSAGSVNAYLVVAGQVGNTNRHSYTCFVRGNGYLNFYSQNGTSIASSTYIRPKLENVAPVYATDTISFAAEPGQTFYFLLPQLEELPYSTSINPSAGSTSTRAATSLSCQTAGNLRGNDVTVGIEATHNSVPTASWQLFNSGDTTNGILGVSGLNQFYYRKYVSASSYIASIAASQTVAQTFKILSRLSTTSGVDIFASGSKGTNNNNATTATIGSTLGIGSGNSSFVVFNGYLRNLKIYWKALSDDRCKQLTL